MFPKLSFVAFFMAAPAACLIYGWLCLRRVREPVNQGCRVTLATVGLVIATTCLVLTSGFLLQGYYPDAQSFASPAPRVWIILNRTCIVLWALTIFAAAFGKGRLRLCLLAWCLAMPLFSFMAITAGYLY
jgi:hypothetical protein